MEKLKKVLGAAAGLMLLIAVLSGCGKEEKQGGQSGKEFVYVPEYANLAVSCDYMNSITAAGDYIYFTGDTYAEEEGGEYRSSLYQYNLLENQVKELMKLDEKSNKSLSSMAVAQDGNLVAVFNNYEDVTDENGEVIDSKSTLELCRISTTDGSVSDTQDITGALGESEWAYVQYLCVDNQDNIYACDGDGGIHVFSKDMQKLCDIKADGWINSMVTSREGDVYVQYYGNGSGTEFRKVDVAAKKLGDNVAGISDGSFGGIYFTGATKSILVSSNDQVSLFDISSGTMEDLFKWLDADVNGDNVNIAGELSDGRIWAITRDYGAEEAKYELIYLTRKKASEVKEKEEILYGALWLGSDLRKKIIDFNKTSDQYRITVKTYMTDDYETGLAQFNADLTTGSCPDIIDLSSIDFHQYASKGVLEDLYPYMEKSGIRKEEYLENVLKAFEQDGKLYGIMPQFYISTTLAKTSLIGERNGWTLSEMLDFVEENDPENVFDYASRASIFYYCIYNNIDEFIDWETGECSFEGEEFIRTLEFAAKFPEEYDYNQEREEGLSSKLRNNKLLLMQTSISSVQEYQMMNGMFGEPVSFVGYPNGEKKGNLIQPASGSVGIGAKSKHKEGAWKFVESLISEEFQDSLISEHGNYGFPIKKSALEKQFELDMKPEYYEDENGEQVEQMKTSWGYDDFSMDIYAATQEEVDGVKALIESCEKLSGNVDNQLVNIITEESEAFFKGQKSAADTAGVIQNRAQIYVNENR